MSNPNKKETEKKTFNGLQPYKKLSVTDFMRASVGELNNYSDVIIVEETNHSPYLILNRNNFSIIIKGRSIIEDTKTFYSQLREWVISLIEKEPEEIVLNLIFEFVNTCGTKGLLNLFLELRDFQKHNKKVIINWYYQEEDDSIFELGQDNRNLFDTFDFNLIPVEDIYSVNIENYN